MSHSMLTSKDAAELLEIRNLSRSREAATQTWLEPRSILALGFAVGVLLGWTLKRPL